MYEGTSEKSAGRLDRGRGRGADVICGEGWGEDQDILELCIVVTGTLASRGRKNGPPNNNYTRSINQNIH
jgi:hypothetical protein